MNPLAQVENQLGKDYKTGLSLLKESEKRQNHRTSKEGKTNP